MDIKTKQQLNRERDALLYQWERWFETPLIVLSICWLVLIIIELTVGLSPILETLSFTIWLIFVFDYAIRFFLAPQKMLFIKHNWLILIALLIPPMRIFRALYFFRFARATRSVALIKIFSSIRRGMQVLGATLGRSGFGYILSLTLIVVLLGSAGIYTFEKQYFKNYGEALWWTSMIMTTMGSDMWPKTPEGRILCLGLSIYAFAIFGYITAIVASFLIKKEKKQENEHIALLKKIEEIQAELKEMNTQLKSKKSE
jgi:voltage-gated potassium channel